MRTEVSVDAPLARSGGVTWPTPELFRVDQREANQRSSFAGVRLRVSKTDVSEADGGPLKSPPSNSLVTESRIPSVAKETGKKWNFRRCGNSSIPLRAERAVVSEWPWCEPPSQILSVTPRRPDPTMESIRFRFGNARDSAPPSAPCSATRARETGCPVPDGFR